MSVFKNVDIVKDISEAVRKLLWILVKHPVIDPSANAVRATITSTVNGTQYGFTSASNGVGNGSGGFVYSYGNALPTRDTFAMFQDRQCYYQCVRTNIGNI